MGHNLLEKAIVSQLVKKFTAFYETGMFITSLPRVPCSNLNLEDGLC
jgi:hypothetical protein